MANDILDSRGMTEAEAIARYRSRNYPKPALTADIAVFAKTEGSVKLLMVRRKGHPFIGCWALPGGFADENEPLEVTAARELEEETALKSIPMQLSGIYSAPGRDPRGWVVSAAYAVCLDSIPETCAGDDAECTAWFEIASVDGIAKVLLPNDAQPAFDHANIIRDAAKVLGL